MVLLEVLLVVLFLVAGSYALQAGPLSLNRFFVFEAHDRAGRLLGSWVFVLFALLVLLVVLLILLMVLLLLLLLVLLIVVEVLVVFFGLVNLFTVRLQEVRLLGGLL